MNTSTGSRGAHSLTRTALVLLTVVAVAASLMTSVSEARAATFAYVKNFGGWSAGAFESSNGQLVYCIEPGARTPTSNQKTPREVTRLESYRAAPDEVTGWNGRVSIGAVSGTPLRQMNWLLSKHGQTRNADKAAAVQIALWFLRDDPGVDKWLDHHLDWIADHGGKSHIAEAKRLAAEARRVAVDPKPLKPASSLKLKKGAQPGEGTLSYPAHTRSVALTGATFTDGKRTKTFDARAPKGSAAWSVDLHRDGWQRHHRVSVDGEWKRAQTSWAAALTLHPAVEGDQQNLGSMVGPVTETTEVTLKPQQLRLDSQFSPVLATQTESFLVERGTGRFTDRVTLDVAKGSGPWASRPIGKGKTEFLPVKAEGTLYGPFGQPQEVQDKPPVDAPVTARTILEVADGPGEYRAEAKEAPTESGYYYWVWRVREKTQTEEVRASKLLPKNYDFSDRFGLEAEGHLVPTQLRWETMLVEQQLPLDELVLRDRIGLKAENGAWVTGRTGKPLSARLRLTVYVSEEKPERRPDAPEGVKEIARGFADVSKPGESIEVVPIPLPFETRGWVTVQTCLVADDQPKDVRGFVEEWCDDFGMPGETAQIVEPAVTTEAVPEVYVGDSFHDVATVTGLVPKEASIGFTYYLRPEAGQPKYDQKWRALRDSKGTELRWSEQELAQLSDDERCLAQPVATTDRVAVTTAGETRSPEVRARSVGVGYWVEDLDMPHPDTGERVELHRGACGLENERTTVTEPPQPEEPAAVVTSSPRLPETGSTTPLGTLGLLAGASVLAGFGTLLLRRVRPRREER